MFESKLNENKANGYPSLNGVKKIDRIYLPKDIYVYQGEFDSDNSLITFTNTTGGTFTVTGITTGGVLNWYAEYSASPTTAPIVLGYSSIAIGDNAQANSEEMFVYGVDSGFETTNTVNSNFIGSSAGYQATNAYNSNFLGQGAGYVASEASFSNFLGTNAGYYAIGANYSNFIGSDAGNNAIYASYSNFLGQSAGANASSASNSNFMGLSARIS